MKSAIIATLLALWTQLLAVEAIFSEKDGVIVIEAEKFTRQTNTDKRAWHVVSARSNPNVTPDGDPLHLEGASDGAYIEALPDTRRSDADKLVQGENFSEKGGEMAVLTYPIRVNTPGRWYVWVRTFSTGTEDNGLHFGSNGTWPESGARWQTVQKNGWHWDCAQRTKQVHTGVPMQLWLDIDKAGNHELHLSLREDGAEVDQIILARENTFRPPGVPAYLATQTNPSTASPSPAAPLVQPRRSDGAGNVLISGEPKQWHKITLTLDGPFAHERDTEPNPFTDLAFSVRFTHESGTPDYTVPGYFAADGNAANSSAESGVKWRAHLSPDKPGLWNYILSFRRGKLAALDGGGEPMAPFDGIKGTFTVDDSDKTGRDFRAHGRLTYTGKHLLQFAGTNGYFLKVGADAPETLLGYAEFDGTIAGNPGKVPLKTWQPHQRDWKEGDPVWKSGMGKGLVGALNYLAGTGANAFSFLTYNAGGDGDNVWPFVERDAKFHYDCSKLDQWGLVFDHATNLGLYLHFKLQETEMDDNRGGTGEKKGDVPEALDGGKLGPARKLYCRELIARFGHALALNWNIGEENTQSTEEINEMIDYIRRLDPYQHHVVIHTFPDQQDKVYRPLLGNNSRLSGVSLQNSNVRDCHTQVVKWVAASAAADRPWVVAFDEPGDATFGMPADDSWPGMAKLRAEDKKGVIPTVDDIRKYVLWGTLMGGGSGVEYYFGYKLPENDLRCEDWRSRAASWEFGRIALTFFQSGDIPFTEMTNADSLVGNPKNDNSRYCLTKPGEIYLVYLPQGGATEVDLKGVEGKFTVQWFNPRTGGPLTNGAVTHATGGAKISTGPPPADPTEDWLVIIRR